MLCCVVLCCVLQFVQFLAFMVLFLAYMSVAVYGNDPEWTTSELVAYPQGRAALALECILMIMMTGQVGWCIQVLLVRMCPACSALAWAHQTAGSVNSSTILCGLAAAALRVSARHLCLYTRPQNHIPALQDVTRAHSLESALVNPCAGC
jgi:hypothetical protein